MNIIRSRARHIMSLLTGLILLVAGVVAAPTVAAAPVSTIPTVVKSDGFRYKTNFDLTLNNVKLLPLFTNPRGTRFEELTELAKYSHSGGAADTYTYCINPRAPYLSTDDKNFTWGLGSFTDSPNYAKDYAGEIQWVAQNGFNGSSESRRRLEQAAGVSLTDTMAMAATQAAIWHFSNQYTLQKWRWMNGIGVRGDVSGAESQRLNAAYNYLINNANSTTVTKYGVAIDPNSKSGVSGDRIGPFTITADATDGVVSIDTATDGVRLENESTGRVVGNREYLPVSTGDRVYVQVPAGAEPGEGELTLTATAAVNAGTVLSTEAYGQEHRQTVIVTHNERPVKQTVHAEVNWVKPSRPTIPSTTETTPSTTEVTTTETTPSTTKVTTTETTPFTTTETTTETIPSTTKVTTTETIPSTTTETTTETIPSTTKVTTTETIPSTTKVTTTETTPSTTKTKPAPKKPWLRTNVEPKIIDGTDKDSVTVTDTVNYGDVAPGEYTLVGVVAYQDPDTGKALFASEWSGGNVTVTENNTSGVWTVPFQVSTKYANKPLTVFEYLQSGQYGTNSWRTYVKHRDFNDANQTFTITKREKPKSLHTKVDGYVPGQGNTVVVDADQEKVSITDHVYYSGLEGGKAYTVIGRVVDPINNNATVSSKVSSFTADRDGEGTWTMNFDVPTSYAGKKLVVFEAVYVANSSGAPVASHVDAADAAQSFTIVKREKPKPKIEIGTSVDGYIPGKDTVKNVGFDTPSVDITDHVNYTGLESGTYTLKGWIVDAAGTQKTEEVTHTFTVGDTPFGVEDVTIPVSTDLAGSSLVVFEELYKGDNANGTPIADHKKIDASSQTFTIHKGQKPTLGTTAVGQDTKDHTLSADGGTIIDTVKYTNLEQNKWYTVSGEIVVVDGTTVTRTGIKNAVPFQAPEADGSIQVRFEVPSSYAGKTVVVFEKLHEGNNSNGKVIVTHEDANDGSQTVTINKPKTPGKPVIGTTAVDNDDNDKEISADGGTIKDTVAYQNLVPGKEYTVAGELMIRTADNTAIPTGIKASATFTPESANDSIDVYFNVDEKMAGKTLVVFEKLYEGKVIPNGDRDSESKVVATHADIRSGAQTVTVAKPKIPSIGTIATNDNGGKFLPAEGGTIVDTVTYNNLKTGQTYTLSGAIMERTADGKAVPTGITGTTTFNAESVFGTKTIKFEIPANLAGKTLVVFEKLFKGDTATGTAIATHEKIDSESQTVTVNKPKIPEVPTLGTTAVDSNDGDKVIDANGGNITDTVSFTNLQVGKTYTVWGELMERTTDGKAKYTGVWSYKTFTATVSNGSIGVQFPVPASLAGKTLVVFETLFNGGVTGNKKPTTPEVAVHKDINDEAQSVTVGKPVVPGKPQIATVAVDSATRTKVMSPFGGTISDTVEYKNLVPGQTYQLFGEVMERTKEGKAVSTGSTGWATFTPSLSNASIEVTFEIPGDFAGKKLVVFEKLYQNGKVIASHQDITSEEQAVSVAVPNIPNKPVVPTIPSVPNVPSTPKTPVVPTTPVTPTTPVVTTTPEIPSTPIVPTTPVKPSIGTVLVDKADGDKIVSADGGDVIDTVTYKGLETGKWYTVTGELMDKDTGESTGSIASTSFTAPDSEGSVLVTFKVPGFLAGKTLVAFEKLYEGKEASGTPIAKHEDINDAAQTVTVGTHTDTKPRQPGTEDDRTPGGTQPQTPDSGSSNEIIVPAIIGAAVLGIAGVAAVMIPAAQPPAHAQVVPAPVIVHKRQGVLAVTGANAISPALLGMVLLLLAGGVFASRRRRTNN